MRKFVGALAAGMMLGCASIAAADPVPRNAPAAGSVIARKTGEEVRFIDVSDWRGVDIHQDLLAGDELRTNALGSLAVLFADNTQVRLGRNTVMVVKEINPGADSRFSLESGSIWARAERGGEGLVIETPAAAAAIRGTDWTMTVVGDRTSLTVLEGKVELSNSLGSVTVVPGEAASARIGQAPTKTVIVAPDDREQMLFYLSLRDSFLILPASPLSSREMRQARQQIAGIPEAARTGEQWLTLAEVALSYDGRVAAKKAADQARGFRLAPAQRARLDLVDAMIAASEKRYADAIPLFARAAPKLSGSSRAIADYGGYFSRALVDPERAERPPGGEASGPAGAIAAAWTAGFLQDIPAAIEIIRRAEQRYPDDPTLPAVRAQLAVLVDDRPQAEEAIQRALALDPDDPTALEARARYRVMVQSDLEGALADATRAAELMPGSTSAWNLLGIVLSARDAEREAEAAFLKGVELDPQDPLARANLAMLYLDQGRVAKARAEIDKAMAEDPGFDIGLIAKGRYHIQTGETDKAVQDLLAASTANPAYAQALLLLAAAYYENGEKAPAEQALENADRLDPNDPVIPTVAAMIAIDEYDSDRAIRSAQEALRRARARGGDYSALSASLSEGSTLNDAFRFQGLDAWGRYYGDAVFDPFTASAYIDQAVAGSAAPFVNSLNYGFESIDPRSNGSSFSSYFQGLMLDPMMISNRHRGLNLLRSPFVETSIGGGFVADSEQGWNGDVEVQGHQITPVPWSFYANVAGLTADSSRSISEPGFVGTELDTDALSGTAYVAVEPTAYDRVVAFTQFNRLKNGIDLVVDPDVLDPGVLDLDVQHSQDSQVAQGGVAWSHTLGYRNVANAAVFVTAAKSKSSLVGLYDTVVGTFGDVTNEDVDTQYYLGALNHMYGMDDVTLRYGVEGGYLAADQTTTVDTYIFGIPIRQQAVENTNAVIGRAYIDALYDVTPDLKLEGALFGTYIDGSGKDVLRAEPRIGLAWTPAEGHWLRAGYMREATSFLNASTLAPVDLLGLQSNQIPLAVNGYSDTFMARWDAEWTNRFFTAVDYQHQELRNLAIDIPAAASTIDLSRGRIDRVSVTGNVWLGNGFGLFATAAYADSENLDSATSGLYETLPFIPEYGARVGLTYVNPANVKVTLAATYVGERAGNVDDLTLDDYWTADAFLTWEPFDKRFELQLAGYNLLNEDFMVAALKPGWGRTFTGSLKMRF
ncbi:tetratricopeptide repeat protein [Mesorhizobium sp. LHD-90]|uniref:FecR domain-containing protein n=1 Tax=Mesorhizobium sp. LHD-90 TaxID=3071414 RepID=UPI0027E04432|nr:tetratricopeptide repeat protein [Mesorhizobium sp. LHD-90]MDQ6434274.1 tetratricopeptide repeat protein [Mesorhizobium sp. LHD-90]